MLYKKIKLKIEKAISELKSFKSIIILDDEKRENEADLVFPAELANHEHVNLMIQYGSGIVCLSMQDDHAKKLDLHPMVLDKDNNSQFKTPFTISIDAKKGISTGVSSYDRAKTIRIASKNDVSSDDLVKPGHIFPLISNKNGVLGREGHTEASVDIVRLAGFKPIAVICELVNSDGSMMRIDDVNSFACKNNLTIIRINDIRVYRLANENLVKRSLINSIPLKKYGVLEMSVFTSSIYNHEIMVLTKNFDKKRPLVGIHSSCVISDLFGSLNRNFQSQFYFLLEKISKNGGIFIYLINKSKTADLLNNTKSYEVGETRILDFSDTRDLLDLSENSRSYDITVQILRFFGIKKIRLLLTNSKKNMLS